MGRVVRRVDWVRSGRSAILPARQAWPARLSWLQPRGFADQIRADDEAARGVADEFERIAGDQGQRRLIGWIEHVDIVRIDGLRSGHPVAKHAVRGAQGNGIALAETAERPKNGVAMSGNPDVAGLSRKGGVLDVPGRTRKRAIVAPLQDGCRQGDGRRFEPRDPGPASGHNRRQRWRGRRVARELGPPEPVEPNGPGSALGESAAGCSNTCGPR